MNAELFRELNIIMTDESMMEKAIKALHRITMSRKRLSKSRTAIKSIDWDTLPELPEEFMQLRGMGHFTKEDLANDDRLAYIIGK